MRLLLDANLSPRLAEVLRRSGNAAAHVADLGLLNARDTVILERSERDGFVLVTADTDFPMLVALRRASSPSVVLLRDVNELSVERHAELLTSNLPLVTGDLDEGAIVPLSPHRMRVRALPIR
jgi:predicted nuclease of predicted toxin-antitoxin system